MVDLLGDGVVDFLGEGVVDFRGDGILASMRVDVGGEGVERGRDLSAAGGAYKSGIRGVPGGVVDLV